MPTKSDAQKKECDNEDNDGKLEEKDEREILQGEKKNDNIMKDKSDFEIDSDRGSENERSEDKKEEENNSGGASDNVKRVKIDKKRKLVEHENGAAPVKRKKSKRAKRNTEIFNEAVSYCHNKSFPDVS